MRLLHKEGTFAHIQGVLVQQAEGELWTHRAGPKAKGKSKIDCGVEFGVEAGKWRGLPPMWARGRTESGMKVDLSDHAVMRFRRVAEENVTAAAEQRPKPARLGALANSGSLAGVFCDEKASEEWFHEREAEEVLTQQVLTQWVRC